MIPLLFAAALFPGAAAPASESPRRCVDSSRPGSVVTLAGRLTLQSFAGPPNYESVARGDAEDQVFILELPRSICFEDGEFADGSERFDRVHVHAIDRHLTETLRASIGRDVTVRGKAVGAHTGHHRAPMVLFAESADIAGAGVNRIEDRKPE